MNISKTQRSSLLVAFFVSAAPVTLAQTTLSDADRTAIQSLVASYATALGTCDAEGFADLFAPEIGYFASGFRGHMAGRGKLIALVASERHCLPSADQNPAPRPGGNAPAVAIDVSDAGIFGLVDLGTASYEDEYVETVDGWKFASRTVIIAAEKSAGVDADALLQIHRLGGAELGDNYETMDDGTVRLLNSGVQVTVADGQVTGRAYLQDGSYRDEVYEEDASGVWRIVSSTPGQN